MNKINPTKVLFIKLGEGGKYEKECIEKNQTLRLSYHEVNHEYCLKHEWDKIDDYYINEEHKKSYVATSHRNQIKQFYEEGEKTLWITFYNNKVWWCFSKPKITLLPDGTKTGPVIGSWSDKDIEGKILYAGNISGKLLETQGFRGYVKFLITLCISQNKL